MATIQGAHRQGTPPTLAPWKCSRRSSIRACLPHEFMGLSRSGAERRPRRRVEVCAVAMCVYFVVIIIDVVMMIFCIVCNYFSVIASCNCFSKFEPSQRLSELLRRFLDSRARPSGCLYKHPKPVEPCALVSPSALGWERSFRFLALSLRLWFADSSSPGLQPSPSFS